MKILITGYKGFIGKNLVNALQHEHTLSFYDWGDEFPNFENIDWCIHLGAISSTTEQNVEKIMQQNYDFSCMVLIQCQLNNVNLQYASSAAVYGSTVDFREDALLNPKNPYAWSKYFFDRTIKSIKLDNIVVQGFRYFNVYGPYEENKGDQASPFYKFEHQAKKYGVIKLFEGSENFYRDFIHVDDVINIHKNFFNINETGIWNVGTGKPKSFENIALDIAKKYNAKIEYIPIPENIKYHYQTYTCANLEKLNKTIDKWLK